MEFKTTLARIEEMRQNLRVEFEGDAESSIAEIDRAIELQMLKDPLYVFASELFYRAGIALRRQRIDVARKQQSNGIAENMNVLDARLYRGRLFDFLVGDLRPGEKLLEVGWWALKTNQRELTRAGLKAACRMSVETNDAAFERNFVSDANVRAAEAAERERANPPAAQYGRNTDFPNGIRPRA